MNTMLTAMVADVTLAAASAPASRHRAIAEALAPFLGRPGLLDGIPCPTSTARYVRHLVHEDRSAGWAMVALAWLPGQASPVHGHRTWCAFGVHEGWLEERHFALAGGLPVLGTALPRAVGATSAGPADVTLVHQLANVSAAPALSIHVYGVAYDGMGDAVSHVYAAA